MVWALVRNCSRRMPQNLNREKSTSVPVKWLGAISLTQIYVVNVLGYMLESLMIPMLSFSLSTTISMIQCKNDVTPVLTHWSYIFRALTHRRNIYFVCREQVGGRITDDNCNTMTRRKQSVGCLANLRKKKSFHIELTPSTFQGIISIGKS